jgi:hypothetical protein
VDFVAGNSNKLPKLGLEGKKNQLNPQCVHIVEFIIFSILKMWKIKECVHTWANERHRLY